MVQFSIEIPLFKENKTLTESGDCFNEILDSRMIITSVLPQSFIDYANENDLDKNDYVCIEIGEAHYIIHRDRLTRFQIVENLCKS
jgi:hypothetical protein